jgi:Ras-related protein Rab-7A
MNFSESSVDHRQMKVLLLGEAGAGKTSILNQFVNREFSAQYRPTVGADFISRQMEVDGTFLTLQIWDTAGQERYRSLAFTYFRGAEICVLCYDITSEHSFEAVDAWYQVFTQQFSTLHPDFPFLLLANKCDDIAHRVVTTERGRKYAVSKNFQFYEVSAKMCDNITDAFESVVRQALQMSRHPQQMTSLAKIDIEEDRVDRPKKCDC